MDEGARLMKRCKGCDNMNLFNPIKDSKMLCFECWAEYCNTDKPWEG